MTHYCLTIRPRSPWRTPWQADTLTGMLLATCARTHGPDVLRHRLIEPMLAGFPPFVLSDACPHDLLPAPIWLRLADWPDDLNRKHLKRARWMRPDAFNVARAGQLPPFKHLVSEHRVFLEHARHHNTLSRLSDTTGEAESGLAPFSRPETLLLPNPSDADDGGLLTLYFRLLDPSGAVADLLLDLVHELSLTGFGADVATGRGQFEIIGDPTPVPELDSPPHSGGKVNAVVCMSTFQPGPTDPTDGLWEAFPKFAKLGPDLGAPDVRKNTLIMFRPGACFKTDSPGPFLGRAVPMRELLPKETADELHRRGLNVIHPSFGLTVPAHLSWEATTS